MYGPLDRHAVHILKQAGVGVKKIMRLTGMSKRNVLRIAQEPPVTALPPTRSPEVRPVGRPSIARPFASLVAAIFKEHSDLPSVEVLSRVEAAGYQGGKSALYQLIAELRPPPPMDPVVRFEGFAGEFSQHDFGQVLVKYDTGKVEKIQFFASRLKFSRWSHVVLVPNQRVESLVRSLLLGLADFGGVPLVCVFDNPKTIVIKHVGALIEWNATFAQVAIDMRFAPELCTPDRPNEKGSVENLVKWVKGSFFKVRRFHDREDLERQLVEWHRKVNFERPSRATGVPPSSRIDEERKRLRPLPFLPAEYPLRFPITVGVTGMVDFDGVRYSMPAKSIGMPGTLFLFPDRIRIVARKFEAEHPRRPEIGRTSYQPEHRAQLLAAVSGARGKLYSQRQQLFELGAPAVEFMTELVHARQFTWKEDVESLHALLMAHGPACLLAALREACARRLFGAEYVVDLIPTPPRGSLSMPPVEASAGV